jgi:membrane-associated phospholipid phosphatase
MKFLCLTLVCLGSGLYAQSPGPAVEWNRLLLSILRTPGAQPGTVHPTRSLAMLHAAIYDAVNAIDQTHAPFKVLLPGIPQGASQDAAADSAAHEVLSALYPSFQSVLDLQYQQSLALIPDGPNKDTGVLAGKTVAGQIVQLRANDGSATAPPQYVPGSGPGVYQSTPPNFPAAAFSRWSQVTPFALLSANQFRPQAPPALTSQTYTDAFNEVMSLGIAHSTAATPDQKLVGIFWNGAIQNYWNEIAQTASIANNLTTASSARLFALLNIAIADTVIAFYDAKYTYAFWRPVTAIRAADTDSNPATAPNPNWLPETGTTAGDPSYPGAHGAVSAAAAAVLASFFGSDQFNFNVASEVFVGVQHSFTSFSAASEEAFLSRIYAGQHFRFDQVAGAEIGGNVAALTTNLLRPTGL